MPTENEIDKKKEHAVAELSARLSEMSGEAYRIITEAIENEFDIEEGKIVAGADFTKRLDSLVNVILQRLKRSPKFTGPVSQFVKRMPEVSSAISDFQKLHNAIKVPAFEATKKIIIDEIINQMLDNGLNHNFVQPLRDLIYRNATTGLSLTQAKQDLKQYIGAGKDKSGKLHSYLEQTAQHGVDLYSGAINKKLMETYNYDGLLITGTIIDNSSPQCIYCIRDLNRTIKRTDWPSVKEKATKKFPLIKGTTFDNLPIMLLHWGCRHGFYPIIT